MSIRNFILSVFVIVSTSLEAQIAKVPTAGTQIPQNNSLEAKLAAGQSVNIAPNPLPKSNPILTITAVHLEIYGYSIINGNGQIVELENLSGKPDATVINLTGAVNPGMYIIRFDTSSGYVTRRFTVI